MKVHPNSLKNLKKLKKGMSTEIQRAGAIASNKKQKETRELKERITIALETLTGQRSAQALAAGDEDLSKHISEVGIEVYTLTQIILNTAHVDPKTSIKAIETIFDRTDGKPLQKQEIADVTNNLNDSEKELIKRQIKREAAKKTKKKAIKKTTKKTAIKD